MIMENLYTYAVARVRSRETTLLSRADIEQLVSADSLEACINILADKGFDGNGKNQSYEELLSAEQEKIWEFVSELTDDMSVFGSLRLENDFHNLKASVKAVYSSNYPDRIYVSGGTVEPEFIYNAVKERDFSSLPEFMSDAAEQAVTVLNKTGDGQMSDCIIDKASVNAAVWAAQKTKNEFLIKLSRTNADIAALKVAVRCSRLKKDADFIRLIMPEPFSFNKESLIAASVAGIDELCEYIRLTTVSEAAAFLGQASAFERWCDNYILELIKEQRYNSFTVAPVVAFILARINEIKAVRIVLSAKINGFSEEIVRERLRDMYV